MDGSEFDRFVRSLASSRSRRSLLRGAAAAAVGGVVLRGLPAAAARDPKVTLCHATGNGSFRQISVSQNAVDSHLAHGDGYLGSDLHCSACGSPCPSGTICDGGACIPDGNGGCNPGEYPAEGGCAYCPPGTYSTGGLGCELCPADTYQDLAGTVGCNACPSGSTTNGIIGSVACVPVDSEPLICDAGAECQSQCPGANSPWCFCGTTFDTGASVCYHADNGCPGPNYCLTAADCQAGEACVNLNGGCGGCDNYILGQTGQSMGVCNRICVTGD